MISAPACSWTRVAKPASISPSVPAYRIWAVALFEAARVPGEIEVKQVAAMALKVQPFPRGIGRDQDAEWMIGGRFVKRLLDLLAPILRPAGIEAKQAICLDAIMTVAHEPTGIWIVAPLVNRRDAVARRQGDDLRALAGEHRIRSHEQRADPLVAHGLEDGFQIGWAGCAKNSYLISESASSRLYFSYFILDIGIVWIG